jgi:hypothetical protein
MLQRPTCQAQDVSPAPFRDPNDGGGKSGQTFAQLPGVRRYLFKRTSDRSSDDTEGGTRRRCRGDNDGSVLI